MFFDYSALNDSIANDLVAAIGTLVSDDAKSAEEKQWLLLDMASSTEQPLEFIAAFLIVQDLALVTVAQATTEHSEISDVINSALHATFSVLQVCTSRLSLTTQAESKN